jgi:UDP-N-acetylmuramoyl-L-alanyl-D-glutamate--2,6-diaminopimelate ligase
MIDAARSLAELLGDADAPDVPISGLAYDSRRAGPGFAFFCMPGSAADGHDFAADAVRRGAAALVTERRLDVGTPEVVVASTRVSMAFAAARFYGQPSRELPVVGITGTNGKTTTAFLLRQILERSGRRCGMLGTIKQVVGGVELPTKLTTPEAVDVQIALRAMVDAGDGACVMECSSHGLAMARCDGIDFAATVFTNLTREHLDFHGTMERYFEAKRRLFSSRPRVAVVNADDPYGRTLAEEHDGATTFAIDRPADFQARDVRVEGSGSRFVIEDARGGSTEVRLALPGRYNVDNALAAFATARRLGIGAETAAAALGSCRMVPGRFERIDEGQPFTVAVDFAHTPDALEKMLVAARELAGGRLLCVFGCVGGRDPGSRAPMGATASRLCDRAIVTAEDCFSEDPEAVIAQILEGTDDNAEVIVDRRAAIVRAIELAEPGDVVVIAGHGHLREQVMADGRRVPFYDVEVARSAIHARLPADLAASRAAAGEAAGAA